MEGLPETLTPSECRPPGEGGGDGDGEQLEDAHLWPRWEKESPRPVVFQGPPVS